VISILTSVVLPVFAVTAVGYLSGKLRLFSESDAVAINKFVFFISLPALVFWLVASVDFGDFPWRLVLGVLTVEFMAYGVAIMLILLVFKRELPEAVLLGLAATYPNHVLFVQPIAVILFGEGVTIPITAIIVIDTTIIFGVTVVMMDTFSVTQRSPVRLLKQYAKNPFILAIAAGWIASLGGIHIPSGIELYLKFSGRAAAPAGLFALGILLSLRPAFASPALPLTVTLVKVVAQPLIASVVLMQYLDFEKAVAIPALMVAAGPSALTSFVLAVNYKVRVDAIAQSIIFTVVAALFSLSIVAAL